MDLYDDLDAKQRAGQIDGWSSGIKLLQTQLALKKATAPPPAKKELPKRPAVSLYIVDLFVSTINAINCLPNPAFSTNHYLKDKESNN